MQLGNSERKKEGKGEKFRNNETKREGGRECLYPKRDVQFLCTFKKKTKVLLNGTWKHTETNDKDDQKSETKSSRLQYWYSIFFVYA